MLSSVRPFELSVYSEVFGIDRTGLPTFAFAVAGERPGVPVPTLGGMTVTPAEGLDRLAAADLIAVAPTVAPQHEVGPAVAQALRDAVNRGAQVAAVGTGVVTLAAAGLLDGRRVAVPSMYAEELVRRFPKVTVDAAARFVDDDPIFTSAGTAAGIDLCLHLLRTAHGASAAASVANSMVLGAPAAAAHGVVLGPPRPRSKRRDDPIAELLGWALGNLHEDLSVDLLARRALQSRRSFARRFRAFTGTSPYAWVLEQRLRLAQQLLETDPDLAVEEAAGRAGFSSAALLRQHFQRRFGCSPTQYRARFAPSSRG
jgi:transcriptional regulator GlxA family with amidase domain